MPWKELSVMDQRKEFVMLASKEGANLRELCRRYEISPTTAYKWLGRFQEEGEAGLEDHSRRPQNSPLHTKETLETRILEARESHPRWGARKLKRWIEDQGATGLPSASTVHAILKRHGKVSPDESVAHQAWHRFEHAQPNDLWQMDFKGHFATGAGRCHPLTVLDDHSRYGLCLGAQGDESFVPTQQRLIQTFRRYGLPWRMTMDNGAPWGEPGRYTRFELWLMRMGIKVSHSRPYHPQTQGKDERFHRTVKVEVLQGQAFQDLMQAQQKFDEWLPIYNRERPHEALAMKTPASRYAPSSRAYPEQLPELEYDSGDVIRKVQGKGELHYKGKSYVLGKAFSGYPVAVRQTRSDDSLEVYFGAHHVATISLKESSISIEKGRKI